MEDNNNCRLCYSEKTQEIFRSFNSHGRKIIDQKDRFLIRKCLICQSVFIADIKIDQNYYDKYYGFGYHSDVKGLRFLNNIWTFINKFITKSKERNIRRYFKGKKEKISILDVGCGNGAFLSSLDPKKFEKNGLDINSEGVEMSRRDNINIYNKPIEAVDFGGKKFDCITLWQVIEHLEDPVLIFENIHRILEDDGVVIFQAPNNDCLGLKYGKDYWFHMDSPRHLLIPNRKAIEYLCKKTGFEVIKTKYEFYEYPLDLFWSVRKLPVKFLIYPLYPLFKIMSKEHLTFVCKKARKDRN